MNLKNVGFYTSILLLVVVIGLGMQNVVLEFQSSTHPLFSQASINYMNLLVAGVNSNNLNNITEKTPAGYQEDNIYLADEGEGGSSVTDILAGQSFFKKIQQKIINPIKFVYNVPSFLISLFGLPLAPFSFITNILNLIFYIGIITMIISNLK